MQQIATKFNRLAMRKSTKPIYVIAAARKSNCKLFYLFPYSLPSAE